MTPIPAKILKVHHFNPLILGTLHWFESLDPRRFAIPQSIAPAEPMGAACCCCCDNVNNYRTTAYRRVENAASTDVKGKVFVITGATGNLGKHISGALYNGGGIVVMTGRTSAKLDKAKAEIEAKFPEGSGSIEGIPLDLSDYDSIKMFVETLSKKHSKIDVLCNNAGLIPKDHYRASKHGNELTFQVNYLSTYILTEKLIPLLQESKAGRIINVGTMSINEVSNPIDWKSIPRNEETFGGYSVDYAEAKWHLACYTEALTRRFKDSKNMLAISADPGIIPGSDMWDDQTCFVRFMARYVCACFTKSAEQGAATATYCAVAPFENLKPGGYYHSGVAYQSRPDCRDPQSWVELKERTVKLVPTSFGIKHET
ncbi:hypothetical protein AAMO2058_000525900 [Amorphochlora amoebiformis]